MQEVMGKDSPEFKAILRDFSQEKTPLENSLDRYFLIQERAFDRRNPQFKGRSPQSVPAGMAGMMIPTATGMDPAEGFMGTLNQQAATLGGPAINPREIDAMIAESMAPASPAPDKEYYSAMEPEFEPMIQKVKTKTSTTKSAKTQKPLSVEKMAEEYTVRPASPAFQQGVQDWSGRGEQMDIDPEILINEMTSSGSPMRRGSFPKRKRKNPGMRTTVE